MQNQDALHAEVTPVETTSRVVIERVTPEIDCGRFAIKRTVGEIVEVEADIFADGHEALAGVLLYRRDGAARWMEVPLHRLGNDRWRAAFNVDGIGQYRYTLQAWIDRFGTWAGDLAKRVEAGQEVSVDLAIGAGIVRTAGRRAPKADAARLAAYADQLEGPPGLAVRVALSEELARLVARHQSREEAASYRELTVVVDGERARFSAWYELFPRSCAVEPGRHGTFADCEARLPYVASMGFDVLYLPPVHPIGVTHRKARNNREEAEPDDPGSPWAIGAREGGHKAVHPQLGTLEDFRRLVESTRRHGMEIALDIAFQCSPDHPYVEEHPEWFRRRPDGTIQYAENPPKKYQDIYPLDFETAAWRQLWDELKGVVRFWIDQGVRIFRVDNPHTKPFAFWEWLIAEIKREFPDVTFLAEAFTRPKIMYRLAKLGFTQSYTYFAWRNTKQELTQYFTELTQTPVREYYRPHLWPNTPDILTAYLQNGGRPAFAVRLVLAATLGAGYGIYGPAFELCENRSAAPGAPPPASEEYLNAEKYEIKHWDLERPESLRGLIARVNQIRRENAALQGDWSLRFHGVDNDQLLCYSKRAADGGNTVLVVVNLDPHHTQAGWTDLSLDVLGLDPDTPYVMHDLLSGARFAWHGRRGFVELNPALAPAHIFRIERGAGA
jgi:starch synthase (maltosyl-transferring)